MAPTCWGGTSCYAARSLFSMLARRFFLAVILLAVGTGIAASQSTHSQPTHDDSWRAPLANRNQFPPTFLFISLEPERATVLSKGEGRLFVNFDYSNILLVQDTTTEDLEIDLESFRMNFQFKYGLGRDLEVAADLPIYWIHRGFLDPFISSYHNTFNLPNKVRDREPDNILRYRWQIDDLVVTEQKDAFLALGDLTLQVKRAVRWKAFKEIEVALRAGIKLPTGSKERFVSSGGTDFAFGGDVSRVWKAVGAYFNINYNITSDLDEVRSKNFLYLMGGVDWRFKPTLAAVLQYEQFQPSLDSEIKVLSQTGRQFALGLRWRRSDRLVLEWRFAEDLSSTSPDFTIGFQVAYDWKRDKKTEGISPFPKEPPPGEEP